MRDDFDLVPIEDDFELVPIDDHESTGFIDGVGEMIGNIPKSGAQFIEDVAQPFLHPIDTAKSLVELGNGIIQLAIPGEQKDEAKARAVGQFFADRYGGLDKVLHTLKTDPVGILADASTLLTGGASLAARAPGVLGKAGKAVSTVGKYSDPLVLAGKTAQAGAKLGGKAFSNVVGGIGTGTGRASIEEAFDAGRKGGKAGKDFRKAFRGKDSPDSIRESAEGAIEEMADQREAGYRTDQAIWQNNPKKIDFAPIDVEWAEINKMTSHKGLPKVGKEQRYFDEVGVLLNTYRQRPDVHNAAGLDALKQGLDSISPPPEMKKATKAVTAMRNKVKGLIVDEIPEYGHAMKRYEDSIREQGQIQKTFSIGTGAMDESTFKKMLASIRDDVTTNYGDRLKKGKRLEDFGADNLSKRLAGESMNSWLPRGGVGKLVGVGIAAPGGASPALLPFTVPKLMGGVAHGAGAGAKLSDQLIKSLGHHATTGASFRIDVVSGWAAIK